MKTILRGRPRLNIPLERIIEAVRIHGQVVMAARELGCSDAYIHKRFRAAGITLAQVLDGLWTGDLLCLRGQKVRRPGS